jgi:hypothetical protein
MIKLFFIYPIVGLIINFLKSIDVIANEGLKDEGLSKFENEVATSPVFSKLIPMDIINIGPAKIQTANCPH